LTTHKTIENHERIIREIFEKDKNFFKGNPPSGVKLLNTSVLKILMGDSGIRILANDTSKATLTITLVMKARSQGNSRAIDQSNTITAGVDVLGNQTELGSCLHGLKIDTSSNDLADLANNSILRHFVFHLPFFICIKTL
jgi:hypothetical protein